MRPKKSAISDNAYDYVDFLVGDSVLARAASRPLGLLEHVLFALISSSF